MHPLETYLRSLSRIRSSGSGVDETSYYGPLETLFNEIGKTLKPKVRCIITLKNRGAGHPDGGLFTADQFQKPSAETPLPGQLPARGALEAKPTKDSVRQIARTKQVKDYLSKYRQLLITNYRDFALTTRGGDGEPIILESYSLAADERAFWEAAAHPRATATTQGKRLEDYLKRVMMHAAPLAAPEDVAWFLASYARDALSRIENADLPALKAVRTSLEESLGLQFEGPKGEHFFRSTLVQTLFYGVFSAWVLWSKEHRPTDQKASFDWKAAAWSLHVPMIRTLFEQIATPSQLGPLGLVEVLDWSAATLNRVDRANFFEKFDEGQAVQYFYEPFLEAFDPALRKQLGVWYTPMEIVQYMVARVDTVLREDLGLEDGLADPNVYVLDPCCGTGTFLVEVLKRIANTLREKGSDALLAQDLKRIARDRVFGFEILPAPFVVAHLQLGLLLRNLGAPLEDYGERISVYLTNALTGWEPPVGSPATPAFPEFVAERDAAAQVKRAEPILVVLGNPPYNSFAGVSPAQELGLVDPYKEGLISEWKIKKFNLDDLYIRFFRLAERRIAEMTGKGIVCYISNFSYLSDPSFVVMRKRFLNEFDKLWFDSMNGDSRETGKLTPDGKPDPSVFSTERNREGIRVGTAVGLMVRGAADRKKYSVRFRNFWGASKRRDLLESLQTANFEACYEHASPRESNRFSFRPQNVSDQYMGWPRLVELSLESPSNGLMEKRGGALIDIDRDVLGSRMKVYYDPDASWNEIGSLHLGLKRNAARFDAVKTRKKVITSESFDSNRLRRYVMRPFDSRWCYYSSVRPLWNEPRPTLWVQCWEGNRFLLSRVKADKTPEGPPFYFVKGLSDDHLLAPDAACFPFELIQRARGNSGAGDAQGELYQETSRDDGSTSPNYSPRAIGYLSTIDKNQKSAGAINPQIIWLHALAIGYSPLYLADNTDGIRQDWPRIPLPSAKKALLASAELGNQVAMRLDTETPVPGVTSGKLRPELKGIAVIFRVGGGQISSDSERLALTAGWGHSGKGGVTMPGKGKILARDYAPDEMEAISAGAKALGLTTKQALKHLGERTCDVYLNNEAYWKNVPSRVWDYVIGGYQVIKKWLSYRERALLGRPLRLEEAREVTDMGRRIAAIVLLEPRLDENYVACKQDAYPWPSESG